MCLLPMQDKNGKIVTVGRAVSGDWNYDCYKISNSCQHPEAAVRLYDYVISDPEINTYIQNFTVESIMNGLDDAGWEKHLQSCERLNVAQYVEDYQNFYNDKKIA